MFGQIRECLNSPDFWWPQVDFDNRTSFCSFRPESWKCAICTFFKFSNIVSVLNHKIELFKLAIFTFSLIRIFYFLKICFISKINWTQRILDYSCTIPSAVRIYLYNYTDLIGITCDLWLSSCLQLATDRTEWVCCVVSCICKAPTQELVQENILTLISSQLGGEKCWLILLCLLHISCCFADLFSNGLVRLFVYILNFLHFLSSYLVRIEHVV